MIVEVARGVGGGCGVYEDDDLTKDSREVCILYKEGLVECGKNLARTRVSSVAETNPNRVRHFSTCMDRVQITLFFSRFLPSLFSISMSLNRAYM